VNTNASHYQILKDSYCELQSQLEEQYLHSAIEKVEIFLKYHPGHALAHNDLGVLYYRKGDKLQALGHYQKANRLAPLNVLFQKNLANFYFKEMAWVDEAATLYQEILKSAPEELETLTALGIISATQGEHQAARAWFERILQLQAHPARPEQGPQERLYSHPIATPAGAVNEKSVPEPFQGHRPKSPAKTPDQFYLEARQLAEQGRDPEAIAILKELIAGAPDHALAHNDLGVIYLRCGDLAQSLERQREAVRLEPDNDIFAKNLVGLYLQRGMTDQAIYTLLDQLRRHPEDVETLTALGNISLTVDHTEEAKIFFERILALEPWNQEARQTITALQPPQATAPADAPQPVHPGTETTSLEHLLARLRSSIPPVPDSESLYRKAQYLAEAGQSEAALSQLEELLAQDPLFAAAHNDLGVLYFQKGEQKRSLEHHRRAVALVPDSLNYRKNLAGMYLSDAATQDKAIVLLTEILRSYPRDIETLFTLGRLSLDLERPEEAKIFLRRLMEIEPWNREAQELLNQASQVTP
jgi:tetratricopeptide (TPR) repeat protein